MNEEQLQRCNDRELELGTASGCPVFYSGGSGLAVVETDLGRIGVNICFDSLIP